MVSLTFPKRFPVKLGGGTADRKSCLSTRPLALRCGSSSSRMIRIAPDVQEALVNKEPVVALESTIVAHGMPYPQNLELAMEVEAILRDRHDVTPATIAIKNGIPRVGLSHKELQDLAMAGPDAQKVTTRDIGLHTSTMSRRQNSGDDVDFWGATTVASTMILAHNANINSFVTGGIGGVHRGAETSMDVSSDLTELSRTPVVVISAGIKSILDIGLTLEYLETVGVPVASYQSDEFPAFFSPRSGFASPAVVQTADEVARAYWTSRQLNLNHGMLVGVANQSPAGDSVEEAIQSALKEADEKGIRGSATTPYLLKRIAELTDGDSLRSNMELVRRNANVGALIAKAIADQQNSTVVGSVSLNNENQSCLSPDQSKITILGGAVLDIVARPSTELILGTSNPGLCLESDGGVGRNVAETLARLGSTPTLCTAVGNDGRGKGILDRFEELGGILHPSTKIHPNLSTPTYLAVLNETGDLHTAVADMSTLGRLKPPASFPDSCKYLLIDGNPPVGILAEAARRGVAAGICICLEPTSVPKAQAIAEEDDLLSNLTYAFPNIDELFAMANSAESTVEDAASAILKKMNPVRAYLVVTMGKDGVLLASKESTDGKLSCSMERIAAVQSLETVDNSTGAGDSLCGAFLHALMNGKSHREAVLFGMKAAVLSLQCSDRAISTELDSLSQ